jgi:hypothetical protein
MEILSFLPTHSHLPVAVIAKRFQSTWHEMHALHYIAKCGDSSRKTNPFEIGNLFPTPWYKPSKMSTQLLKYFIFTGWNYRKYTQRLLRECVSRGDIDGLQFLVDHGLGSLDNPDYCAVAGAAGQLEALKWLRKNECPWDPMEVYREASDNMQAPVLNYLEPQVVGGYDVRRCTHYGMPWR